MCCTQCGEMTYLLFETEIGLLCEGCIRMYEEERDSTSDDQRLDDPRHGQADPINRGKL